jgi:hypothetical protein
VGILSRNIPLWSLEIEQPEPWLVRSSVQGFERIDL